MLLEYESRLVYIIFENALEFKKKNSRSIQVKFILNASTIKITHST